MLQKLLELLYALLETVRLIEKREKVKNIKEAVNETIATGDQRKIEDALGGSVGESHRSYDGMFKRERKERQ